MKTAAITLLFLLTTATLVGQDCVTLRGLADDEVVSLLSSKQLSSDCITAAIRRLGNDKYEPSIASLVRLLDFRRVRNSDEEREVSFWSMYPATNALEEIGESALPAILDVIKSTSTTPISRTNAMDVWVVGYRHEPIRGIAILKHEADTTADVGVKANLLWAVSEAVKSCARTQKKECESASSQTYR